MNEDITFCTDTSCKHTDCMRHISQIRHHWRPHSFADFDSCEHWQEREENRMDEIRTQNYGPEEIKEEDARRFMMAWEAEQKGYTCNDCYLAMGNCHDMRICCEDETGLCDWFFLKE